jgi:hypothetical protein
VRGGRRVVRGYRRSEGGSEGGSGRGSEREHDGDASMNTVVTADDLIGSQNEGDKDGDTDRRSDTEGESGREEEKGFRSSSRLPYSTDLKSVSTITKQVRVKVRVRVTERRV